MIKILVFALVFVGCDDPATTIGASCEQAQNRYCDKQFECAAAIEDPYVRQEVERERGNCKDAMPQAHPCEKVRPLQCMQAINAFEWDCSRDITLDDWKRFDDQVTRTCFVLEEN